MTDSLGNYAFTGLAPGTYTVAEVPQEGWLEKTPAALTYTVTVAANQVISGLDFGNQPLVPNHPGGANNPPAFLTTPPTVAVVGQAYKYNSLALDPDGDPLTYDVPVKPAGMGVDPQTGAVVWVPTANQVGSQTVLLRVQDGWGGVALQPYTIIVTALNHPPVITSTPPAGPSAVNDPYQYQVTAQDPDNDPLTYSFLSAPGGMTVNATTGLISWTPSVNGSFTATVQAADGRGGLAQQSFAITVQAAPVDAGPRITSTAPTTVQLGLTYYYPVFASDADGDPLTYTLTTAPTGMSVDQASGLISWKPTAAQVGSNPVTLQVADDRGNAVPQTFTVNVVEQAAHQPPVIMSTPPLAGFVGAMYSYNLTASDPDGNALGWSLMKAPSGVSLDPLRGYLRWIPTSDEVGNQKFTVQVTDSAGMTATQSFTVVVQSVNLPPVINSVPSVQVLSGAAYSYAVRANDGDGDGLTYSLTAAPSGMTINATSGLISWTAGAVGNYTVTVRVSDGAGNVATQSYTLTVVSAVTYPPVITSGTPPGEAAAGRLYTFTITATDPQGQAITFAVPVAPTGMTINATTGVINWTPTSNQAGTTAFVFVTATDTGGAIAYGGFYIAVKADQPPTIVPNAPLTVMAGLAYHYDVQASDPDGDGVTYALTTAPSGMTIDSLGRISWTPQVADIGPHPVTIVVTDPVGQTATYGYTLTVQADTQPPKVSIQLASPQVAMNTPELMLISAVDNVGVASESVTVNGVAVTLNAYGFATVTESAVGTYTVSASASDAAGNVGTASATFLVMNPAVTGAPTVVLTTPSAEQIVKAPTAVIGTASDPNLISYSLSAAPIDNPGLSVTFGTGTSSVTNGTLGTFDPTMLEDGSYVITLKATNAGGYQSTATQTVEVTGNLKLGDFSFGMTDMTISMSGIPITVSRTYSTMNANTSSDFGFGWSLNIEDAKLKVNFPNGGFQDYSNYPAFTEGTRVYVTVPGGKREGFTFKAVPRTFFGAVFDYQPAFIPDPGVADQLQPPQVSMLLMGNDYVVMEDDGLIDYNPQDPLLGNRYDLVTPQGIDYAINATTKKLYQVSDRNGNTLTFSDAGIINETTGVGVAFTRDPQGRIIAVTDPSGQSVLYTYNGAGDLSAVTDRAGHTTQYFYTTNRPHYFDHAVDALGNTVLTVQYDASGHFNSLVTPSGQASILTTVGTLTQKVTDALGNPTTMYYDQDGNVTKIVDAKNGTTSMVYNANDNLLSETNQMVPGQTTGYTYDSVGDKLTQTDPMGNTSYYTYDQYGDPLTSSDPLGDTTTNTYDGNGNLVQTVSPTGVSTVYQYDANGDVTGETGPDGTTSNTYDSSGNRLSNTSPTGVTTYYSYDANNDQTGSSFTWVDPSNQSNQQQVNTSQVLDGNGNVVSSTNEYGQVTQNTYDADGHLIQTTETMRDSTVLVTRDVYDAAGNVIESDNPDGTMTRTVYDADNRPIWTNDTNVNGTLPDGTLPDGTRTIYDPLGKAVKTERYHNVVITVTTVNGVSTSQLVTVDGQPFQLGLQVPFSSTSTGYNAAEQVTSETDAAHQTIVNQLDADGRTTKVTDPLLNYSQTGYDAAGRVMSETNKLNDTTHMYYDGAGNLVKTLYPDGTTTTAGYDGNGRKISQTDQMGQTTRYQYDAQGNLRFVTQPAVINPVVSGRLKTSHLWALQNQPGDTSIVDDIVVLLPATERG